MATSRTLQYVLNMDSLVAQIVEYYGEKFAYIVLVPAEGGSGEAQAYSDDSSGSDTTQYIEKNLAKERLEDFYIGVWKETVTPCWDEIEEFCSSTLVHLFDNTLNAVGTATILEKEKVEEGQVTKTVALGELCEADGIKIARDRVQTILDSDFDFGLDNMSSVERIIYLLEEVIHYINRVVQKGTSLVNNLQVLESSHSSVHGMWGELVLFSDGGDVITHKYHTTPKSKNALQSFNPFLSNTMDRIEASVPAIINDQQANLNMWHLVDKIDKTEFASNHYLEKAYNSLLELKELSKKQYLSNEIPDIGTRTSDIVIYLTGALSDTKSNETYDTILDIQQYMQLTVLDGLNPSNIISRVATNNWKSGARQNYSAVLQNLQSSLNSFVKTEKPNFSPK